MFVAQSLGNLPISCGGGSFDGHSPVKKELVAYPVPFLKPTVCFKEVGIGRFRDRKISLFFFKRGGACSRAFGFSVLPKVPRSKIPKTEQLGLDIGGAKPRHFLFTRLYEPL